MTTKPTTERKLPRLRSVFAWLHRHSHSIIVIGFFITCVGILLSRGEGFLKAVEGSFIFVNWFLSGPHSSDPTSSRDSIPLPILAALLLILIGIVVYWWVKYPRK